MKESLLAGIWKTKDLLSVLRWFLSASTGEFLVPGLIEQKKKKS